MHSLNVQQTTARPQGELVALAALGLFCALLLPTQALAHAKGLYKTQADAEKRAKELGCKGRADSKFRCESVPVVVAPSPAVP